METIEEAGKDYPVGWPELGKVLLWGSLMGFGSRGLVGLGRLAGRRVKEKEETEDFEEAHKEQLGQMVTTPGPDALQAPAPKIASLLKQASGLHPLVASVLGVAGGAGGAYGGWKLADLLFDRERIKSIDEEIELAKKEYENALVSKTKFRLQVPKVAAFIDSMAEAHENGTIKEAGVGFLDALPYLIYTVLAGAAANEAYKAYNTSRSASPTVAKLKALEDRPPTRRVMPIRATLDKPLDETELQPDPSMAV